MEIGNAYVYWMSVTVDERKILDTALNVYMAQDEDDITPSAWEDAANAYGTLNSRETDEYHISELEAMRDALIHLKETGPVPEKDMETLDEMLDSLCKMTLW